MKLKVFRTAIGFHDAYVAAPSRKAALAAWGSDKDLFARGAAELVEDATLTAEPLASPGKVIRKLRGTPEEQIAALPPDAPERAGKPEGGAERSDASRRRRSRAASRDDADATAATTKTSAGRGAPRLPPRPRPSRAALDAAERAVSELEERHAAELKEHRDREETLRRERREMADRHDRETNAAAGELSKAESSYRLALGRWRSG